MQTLTTSTLSNTAVIFSSKSEFSSLQKELELHGFTQFQKTINGSTGEQISLDIYCNSILKHQRVDYLKTLLSGRGFKVAFLDNQDTIRISF